MSGLSHSFPFFCFSFNWAHWDFLFQCCCCCWYRVSFFSWILAASVSQHVSNWKFNKNNCCPLPVSGDSELLLLLLETASLEHYQHQQQQQTHWRELITEKWFSGFLGSPFLSLLVSVAAAAARYQPQNVIVKCVRKSGTGKECTGGGGGARSPPELLLCSRSSSSGNRSFYYLLSFFAVLFPLTI